MNFSINRYSMLEDEQVEQLEDELASTSVSTTNKKSRKKKKSKNPIADVIACGNFTSDSRETANIPVITTANPTSITATSTQTSIPTFPTSSGPPPAYSSHPDFVAYRSRSDPEVRINADGSPMPPRSEFVQVGVDIRWPDKNSKYSVRRGTKEEDLKSITPVKRLLDFGKEADITVSPPNSAKSDTKIHVDSSYEILLNNMKEDLAQSMESIIDKRVQKSVKEFEKSLKERAKYQREFSSYLWMRTLQDLVYAKMSTSMNVEDIKAWSSFEKIVDAYSDNNTVDILTSSDLDHLKKATDRTRANSYAHPDLKNKKAAELRWKALDDILEEDGKIEERERYKRYYEFARG